MPRGWLHLSRPWDAVVDLGTAEPARFYVSLVGQALRYGRPAARRPHALWSRAARLPLPVRPAAGLVRTAGRIAGGPTGPSPQVDAVLAGWDELRARDATLPPRPDRPGILELRRSAGRTAFVFAPGEPTPLLVAKTADGPGTGVAREAAALERAAALGLAPRPLGAIPGVGSLQRGLPGSAVRVVAVRARRAGALAWPAELTLLAGGLQRLAEATAVPVEADVLADGVVDEALGSALLPAAVRTAVTEARARLRARPVAVLAHSDTSPQNVLVHDGALSGLVDWELARTHGLPGADLLNGALAWLEQGVGLVRWTDEALLTAFRAAWCSGPFGSAARAATAALLAATGPAAPAAPDVELVWLARRVGQRLRRPAGFPTTADLAARQLAAVVGTRPPRDPRH